MIFYIVCFVLSFCNYIISSYLPLLSHQERVQQAVERQFGGAVGYEEHQRALVLRFFKERIALARALEQEKEPKQKIVCKSLKHIYELAQPKAAVREVINLPVIKSKKLTEQEKFELFARLAEPKSIAENYHESHDDTAKVYKKRAKK